MSRPSDTLDVIRSAAALLLALKSKSHKTNEKIEHKARQLEALAEHLTGNETVLLLDILRRLDNLPHSIGEKFMALLDPINASITELTTAVNALIAAIPTGDTATPEQVQATVDSLTAVKKTVTDATAAINPPPTPTPV
jgi:hypothetical protein